jgi:hypothetical protein
MIFRLILIVHDKGMEEKKHNNPRNRPWACELVSAGPDSLRTGTIFHLRVIRFSLIIRLLQAVNK